MQNEVMIAIILAIQCLLVLPTIIIPLLQLFTLKRLCERTKCLKSIKRLLKQHLEKRTKDIIFINDLYQKLGIGNVKQQTSIGEMKKVMEITEVMDEKETKSLSCKKEVVGKKRGKKSLKLERIVPIKFFMSLLLSYFKKYHYRNIYKKIKSHKKDYDALFHADELLRLTEGRILFEIISKKFNSYRRNNMIALIPPKSIIQYRYKVLEHYLQICLQRFQKEYSAYLNRSRTTSINYCPMTKTNERKEEKPFKINTREMKKKRKQRKAQRQMKRPKYFDINIARYHCLPL
ncbi:hypothetical protein SNEBB_008711 [Seison nebaliae]|nr:hypothetical protein SNEBB_008711 [Seison nebaliae]